MERSAMKIPNGNDDHHNGYNDKIQFVDTCVVGCCDFTLAACFVEWEGTSGGRGVSKYDFIEPANAVNDGNWKANVIINVRRLI